MVSRDPTDRGPAQDPDDLVGLAQVLQVPADGHLRDIGKEVPDLGEAHVVVLVDEFLNDLSAGVCVHGGAPFFRGFSTC